MARKKKEEKAKKFPRGTFFTHNNFERTKEVVETLISLGVPCIWWNETKEPHYMVFIDEHGELDGVIMPHSQIPLFQDAEKYETSFEHYVLKLSGQETIFDI